jgi:hypothetical protein
MNAYRVTVEQMAILEPALSETFVLTCMYMVREAIDEAVKRGVPAEAAREFILGHLNINVAILFGFLDIQFSDGAKLAVERARPLLFNPDWRQVFEPENVMEQVKAITQGRRLTDVTDTRTLLRNGCGAAGACAAARRAAVDDL